MTIPSSMTRTLPGTETCRPRPVTETYVPTAIRSLDTKHSAVTSGRSDRGAMSAARRWLSSSASCASSSRLSTSAGQFPLPPSRGPSARQTARTVRRCRGAPDGRRKGLQVDGNEGVNHCCTFLIPIFSSRQFNRNFS